MDDTQPRRLAVVTNYDGVIECMRARVVELGWTMEDLEIVTRMAKGHPGKILGEAQVKTLGRFSFDCLMGGLGIEFHAIENPALTAKAQAFLKARQHGKPRRARRETKGQARIGRMTLDRVRPAVFSDMGKRSAVARKEKLTPKDRKRVAKLAARARWGKPKRWRKKKRSKSPKVVPAESQLERC